MPYVSEAGCRHARYAGARILIAGSGDGDSVPTVTKDKQMKIMKLTVDGVNVRIQQTNNDLSVVS